MDRFAFDNVWEALEDTPAEAANMTMRADLLIALRQRVQGWGLTQAESAAKLEITQPRMSELLRGRIERFTLDALVDLARRAGLAIRLDIDEAA